MKKRTDTEKYMFRDTIMRTYHRLSLYPEDQAEAIIRHYNALGRIVFQLNKMLDFPSSDNKSELVEWGIRQIKNAHAINLGLRLEWQGYVPPNQEE